MRRTDLKQGELYYAHGPGEAYACALGVKVELIETGVLSRSRGGRQARADHSLVRLVDAIRWKRGSLETKHADAGTEYAVANKHISRPWSDADDERELSIASAEARDNDLAKRLIALGLPQERAAHDLTPAERAECHRNGDDIYTIYPGFRVIAGYVQIDQDTFEAWLSRVDLETLCGEVIDRFIMSAADEVPWTGFADISLATRERFKQTAIEEIREEIANSSQERPVDG